MTAMLLVHTRGCPCTAKLERIRLHKYLCHRRTLASQMERVNEVIVSKIKLLRRYVIMKPKKRKYEAIVSKTKLSQRSVMM